VLAKDALSNNDIKHKNDAIYSKEQDKITRNNA